ncbi:MAG: DUF4383 domain-containing protein [Chloroflexota bacterium]
MSTIQKITVGFGVVYLLIGILGFIPGITVETEVPGQGLLLGIFAVNTLHNIAHLVIGAVFIWGGLTPRSTLLVNRAMAVVFLLLVVASFIAPVLEGLPLNPPDTVLHLVSALLTGYLGFFAGQMERPATA